MSWVKTEDELPPEGEKVLGTDSPHGEVLFVTWEGDRRWYWHQARCETKSGPTYWHRVPPLVM